MHVIIFAGGTVRPGKAVAQALESADMIIAADRGAATALQLGHVPSIVVGDFDSLEALPLHQLEARGSQIIRVAAEKDETDTELAVQTAIECGATTITILGALGGSRFDHTIANVMLLAGFESPALRIVDGPSTCWLLRGSGSSAINGHSGDLLSLIPLTAEASGICSTNLYYPLRNETLRFGKPRGVSNVLTSDYAEVSLQSGLLLIIHTDVQELAD